MRYKRFLVTGGAGFIGSAFIRKHLHQCERIVNLDAMTYAGNASRLSAIQEDTRYRFVEGDICDQALVMNLLKEEEIEAIVHFAAETHVDRSIVDPKEFVRSNVWGTFALLEAVRSFPAIHFHHVSTDEVYGSLPDRGYFKEDTPYSPNSPYSASKAASDHFVRAYAKTYGLMTTLSHCSNNYGPFQHPEKLVPRVLLNCLLQKSVPIYGSGMHVRDWLYVDDHVQALWLILERGKAGETYDIGGDEERCNLDLASLIMDELSAVTGGSYRHLLTYVEDRPGHDFRYAINSFKIKKELGWSPEFSLINGLRQTIQWTLDQELYTLVAL